MNLALLDPFRRTVPDRIDSTLTLPQKLHPAPPPSSALYSKSNTKSPTLKKRKKSTSPASSRKKDVDSSLIKDGWNEWHSCSTVAFNRRGTYIAAGHRSGIVAYHDYASRTLSSIFVPVAKDGEVVAGQENSEKNDNTGNMVLDGEQGADFKNPTGSGDERLFPNGITSLSWSRRSRSVLISSVGDKRVCLVDNTHPFGARDALRGLTTSVNHNGKNISSRKISKAGIDLDTKSLNSLLPMGGAEDDASLSQGECESQSEHRDISPIKKDILENKKWLIEYKHTLHVAKMTLLQLDRVDDDMDKASGVGPTEGKDNDMSSSSSWPPSSLPQYQSLVMTLPEEVGTCVQIHPKGIGGLACLKDGSLVLFKFPLNSFQSSIYHDSDATDGIMSTDSDGVYIYLSQPGTVDSAIDDTKNENHVKSFHVVFASFHGRGDWIYAATNCGKLLRFQLNEKFHQRMFVPRFHSIKFSEVLQGYACLDLGDNCIAREIVPSRNGQMLVLNFTDCLKLYNVNDVQLAPEGMTDADDHVHWKPRFVFQDVVSKVKWHACDFSGDGEYVVGGCNNNESGNKYELYFWNTATGVLIDQLTGPQINLNSLSWHPTRSFIAVGTSDGIVDIWGPRMDWTAFAPDFQALQRNVEYIEKEDEFDSVIDCDIDVEAKRKEMLDMIEDQVVVDVTTVDNVLAFDSDSEDEEEVFYFHQDLGTQPNTR